jgi:hypothetical protein
VRGCSVGASSTNTREQLSDCPKHNLYNENTPRDNPLLSSPIVGLLILFSCSVALLVSSVFVFFFCAFT